MMLIFNETRKTKKYIHLTCFKLSLLMFSIDIEMTLNIQDVYFNIQHSLQFIFVYMLKSYLNIHVQVNS